MSQSQGSQRVSRQARTKGLMRKRRAKKAERRAATVDIREAINAEKRAAGHPGWVESQSGFDAWGDDL